jgi:hypothetical protein|tara:strand:- start:152 stop:622 length:471 start_codon:yes stop_codon:yes gene_type:complete
MAREIYCNSVTFSKYSLWHRQLHAGVAMIDCDKICICIACNEPLFLAELVMDVGQQYKKGHTTTKKLAIKANIPAYIIWYKVENDIIKSFKVKRIAPTYQNGYDSKPIDYHPDQWLQYLEHKQVEHYPECTRKDIFLTKIKSLEVTKRKAYAPILS